MELSKLFIQRRFMKKYSQLFLLSSALLSVFSAQLTVQASEANNASKNSNPTTLAAMLLSMFLAIAFLSTTYVHKPKTPTPFPMLFGLMKMDKMTLSGIPHLKHQQLLI